MTSTHSTTRVGIPVLVLGAVMTVACNDGAGPNGRTTVALSFGTEASVAQSNQAAAATALSSLVPITDGRHTLNLERVELRVSEFRLDRNDDFNEDSDGDTDSDSDVDTDREGREHFVFHDGPLVVVLPLDGNFATVVTRAIPEGEFDELELRIRSVRLRGTFDREPFDVTLRVNTRLEFDFDPPLFIGPETERVQIRIAVNPVRWLRERDGSLVNPFSLETNEDLRARVRARIIRSFRVFEHDRRHNDG